MSGSSDTNSDNQSEIRHECDLPTWDDVEPHLREAGKLSDRARSPTIILPRRGRRLRRTSHLTR